MLEPVHTDMPPLSTRFQEALVWAAQLHANQVRKGSGVYYISHLLAVTALVLEDGGDEDQAIAALLHDAVEDQGGLAVLEEIRLRFGSRVADIVDGCTDAYISPKPPWRERKEAYLEHLLSASPEVIRVSLADKVHNARATLLDLRSQGAQVFERFNGKKDGTLWYYRSLVEAFQGRCCSPLVEELTRVVAEMERLAR